MKRFAVVAAISVTVFNIVQASSKSDYNNAGSKPYSNHASQFINIKTPAILVADNTTDGITAAKRPENPLQLQPIIPQPQINLPQSANGELAIKLLTESGQFEAFSSYYGMTINESKQLFLNDSSVYVDPQGNLLFIEKF